MPTVSYLAPCPSCSQECWWRARPNSSFDESTSTADIDVDCEPCKQREHTLRAQRAIQQMVA